MLKNLVWGLVLGLIAASTVSAQNAVVEFEGQYWISTLSAETKVTLEGRGTDIDIKSDLGIADKNFFSGRFNIFAGQKNRLTFSYTPISYESDSPIKRTVEFSGETYTVNTLVVTTLNLQYLRFGWAFQFINVGEGAFKFGTLVEVKGVKGDVSLAAPNLAIDNAWEYSAWLPTIGLAMDINPAPYLNIFAEISGMSAGDYGMIWEAEGGIKLIPFKNFSISGGYRVLNIEARKDRDYARLSLGGPYVGLSLRF